MLSHVPPVPPVLVLDVLLDARSQASFLTPPGPSQSSKGFPWALGTAEPTWTAIDCTTTHPKLPT